MPIKKKTKKLKPQDKKLIEEIIRVDHAGEHGATQIYRGQLAIFNENTEFGKEIKDILISVQAIDKLGNIITIPAKKILQRKTTTV